MTGCKTLYIGGCYCAKLNDEVALEDLDYALSKISSRTNNIVLAAGDFNLPGWDWKTKSLKFGCPYPNLYIKFADILQSSVAHW